jgi:hypothetical protein
MDERTRFRETLLFGKPDKIPLEPGGPRESTLAAWHAQGLPEGGRWRDHLWKEIGVPIEPIGAPAGPGVSFRMIPEFEEKVLEHRDGHYVVQDWMGAITEISDTYDLTYIRSAKDFVTRKWHRFPVQSRKDFEERIRWRYDPHHPSRFPADFEERCERLRDRRTPLEITINGPFWQLREWLGLEALCLLFAEDQEFLAHMIEFWSDFVTSTLEPLLARVELDCVWISEDMAYKEHCMVSPAMVRAFLLPSYRRWVAAIKASGCPIVAMDSDGYIAELIPLWIEAGFNCCGPMEVAAGNDIVEYRRRFGRRMAFTGGIDKRALAKGGGTMRAEVLRVVPPLLKDGGFLPGCDHGVPPDISWKDFVDYARLLAELLGWR